MKKILFLDRDGTIIHEPKDNFQVDSLDKFKFIPGAITYLAKIALELDYLLVLVSNQDGLGTDSFPYENFEKPHNLMLKILKGEGIVFFDEHIDPSFEKDNSPNRKPGTGMLKKYLTGDYDLKNSFVIGDRVSDIQLAENIGCKAIYLNEAMSWSKIYQTLLLEKRVTEEVYQTSETKIYINMNLDGQGLSNINTGLSFFNHMLEQLAKHAAIDLTIQCDGDLHIDEHHTIEDTAICLGRALRAALGKKTGIERYAFDLCMDESLASVAFDLSGRAWLVWEVEFKREKIGDMPTEMFFHFFKTLSDNLAATIHITSKGENEHHMIEAIFKSFAKCLKIAKTRDISSMSVPSTKGKI